MKKVWKKATVLLLCVTILTTSVVYNYQSEDKNAKTANDVAKNEEKENKGQKSKWKSKTKSNDEVKLLNASVSYNADSDGDGMTDTFEIINNMNPNEADNDGNEILDGKDTYTITYTSQDDMTEDEAYLPSVEMTATGEQLQTLAIGAVDDNPLLCNKIPGYIGHAYNFTMDGEFEQATLNFEVDDSVDMKKEPTVYYYNEETQELEELKTTVKGHMVSAVTTHFSKYILVYKQDFNNFKTVDPNGNDYMDLLCNNKLLLGISMIVSSNISFERQDKRPVPLYGDITEKYDSSYLDSIEGFYEKYKDVKWRGNIIGSYRDLYCSFERVITDDTGQKYEDTVNTENLYGTGYYKFKYNETESDSANWDVCLRQLRNSNRRLEDMYEIDTTKHQQLKFNEMYLTSNNNMQNLNAGISDLLDIKKKYTSLDVPLCGAIVYVIGEVHDSEDDLQRIFKIGQDNNMSVYIINLGSGKKQEEKYKNAIDIFLGEQSVAKESNPNMNEINVRYYYAENNGKFKNILEGADSNIVFDIMEDYELVDTDHDGLSDLHEYMIGEGDITTKTGVRVRDILDVKDDDEISNENSEGSDNKETLKYTRIDFDKKDTDEDGILDGDEIEVKKMEYYIGEGGRKEISYKAIIHSDPTRKDTDGDGFDDKEEKDMGTNPMRYDITDVTLGYGARFAYCNVQKYVNRDNPKSIRQIVKERGEKLKTDKEKSSDYFDGNAYEVLKNFEVIAGNDSGENEVQSSTSPMFDGGLGISLLHKKIDGKDNYIVCCRGTEFDYWQDVVTDIYIGTSSYYPYDKYTQLKCALKEVNNWMQKDGNWYITGHSLGGRIAQDVFVYSQKKFNAGATFNGLGYITKNLTDIEDFTNAINYGGMHFTLNKPKEFVMLLEILIDEIYDDNGELEHLALKGIWSYFRYLGRLCSQVKIGKINYLDNPKVNLHNNVDRNSLVYKHAKDSLNSKYGGNYTFNNYAYKQDCVGGALGYKEVTNNTFDRLGKQNMYNAYTITMQNFVKVQGGYSTHDVYETEYTVSVAMIDTCNKNAVKTKENITLDCSLVQGETHKVKYISNDPRIRESIKNDIKNRVHNKQGGN